MQRTALKSCGFAIKKNIPSFELTLVSSTAKMSVVIVQKNVLLPPIFILSRRRTFALVQKEMLGATAQS